ATHYVEIKKDARGKNLLKLTLCYSEADYSNGKCLISVQNEKFEKIFFTSKWVGAEFRETFKEIDHIQEMINLPSPSAIFRRMSFKDKVN
ncbi:hypothetical protein LCGC14_3162860, partial [marine sediment metagenome]